MNKFLALCLNLAAFTCLAGPSRAETCPELPGFAALEDLPVYDGSCLFGAENPGFSNLDLPTGPLSKGKLTTTQPVEGQLQRRLYVAPEGTSPLDLFRNYTNALDGAGFVTLFECAGRDCGSGNALLGKTVIYGSDRKLKNLKAKSEFALNIDGEEYFRAARSADGTRHVAIYVAQNKSAGISGQASGRAAVHIDLITAAALEARMIDAAAMAKGIMDEGHVAVDNVYFDFGTANLSPTAAPAIAEMAKLLTDNPNLRVFIVGHTDWVGDVAANQALSQARAASVVAALAVAGVAKERLAPIGVGMYAPRAANSSDAGRALNRRVELVEQPPAN